MKTLFLALSISLTFLLTACEESQETKQEIQSKSVAMLLNKEYLLNPGDHIDKKTDDAVLKIIKNSKTDQSRVTLISGQALLTRQ